MASITSKELTALEDQLTSEQLLVKKYRSDAETMTDSTLKQKYQQIADIHQNHYNRLMSYLQ